jgi:DNA-binding LytR/AlgR family response regulator
MRRKRVITLKCALLISNAQEEKRIVFSQILFVVTIDYLSTFHLKNGDTLACSKSLKEILTFLPNYFIQISRSCAVNLNEVASIKRRHRKIVLSASSELTASARRMKIFHASLASTVNTIVARYSRADPKSSFQEYTSSKKNSHWPLRPARSISKMSTKT